MSSNNHDSISAVDFTPSTSGDGQRRIKLWQIVVGISAVIAISIFWFLFTSKSVKIDFNVPTESVRIDGGFVFELGGVYLLREGSYQLSATADLHEPLNETVVIGSQRNQTLALAFTPLPGFLNLTLLPSDATVKVDGQLMDANNPIQLSAGQHELSVEHPRYLPEAVVVEIEGKEIHQSLDVTLAPNWAEVSLTSLPTGAEIWIDNEPSGITTPGQIEAMAGEREISLHLDGYKIHRQRIFAQAGLPIDLDNIPLVQADARLNLTSTPSAAGVTLNGQFVGRTPLTLDLKSGAPQRVMVIQNGYASYNRSLQLSRGAQQDLHARLVRQTGEVVVRVQPEQAQLRVNGVLQDTANGSLTLPVEEHSIALTLEGYAGYTQTIVPKVGLKQELKVKLLTLEEARLAAITPTVTTASGQNLKLFAPYDFTMGASRREPGRRANETLRPVSMTKLFYLSTHEVTNAQFREFASGHDSGSFEEVTLNEGDMPVTSVSWHEVAAYLNWLSNKDNLAPYYNIEFGKVIGQNTQAKGYRLPTEAEWAWAARTLGKVDGGAQPTDQLRFPWGKNLPPPDRHGNYADRAASSLVGRIIFGYNDNYTAAAPIGTYKANHHGLFDMGGNVAEWVHDFYDIPNGDASTDPTGPSDGEYRVIRGSSWMHGTITELRLSFRDYGIEGRQDVGFRIARNAE